MEYFIISKGVCARWLAARRLGSNMKVNLTRWRTVFVDGIAYRSTEIVFGAYYSVAHTHTFFWQNDRIAFAHTCAVAKTTFYQHCCPNECCNFCLFFVHYHAPQSNEKLFISCEWNECPASVNGMRVNTCVIVKDGQNQCINSKLKWISKPLSKGLQRATVTGVLFFWPQNAAMRFMTNDRVAITKAHACVRVQWSIGKLS